MNIFAVSKFHNANTILQNINQLNVLYKNFKYTLIIPNNEDKLFKKFFKSNFINNINIVLENSILTKSKFREIYYQLLDYYRIKSDDNDLFENIGWYYQQALKISFAILHGSKSNLVMIDADTILLKSLQFFDNKNSIVYLTPYERNIPYKEISELIYNVKFKNWISATSQLFSTTPEEISFLLESFNKFELKKKDELLSHWVSRIILKSVLIKFKNFGGSFFGEQDLISANNQINGSKNLKYISFIRFNLKNKLTSNQIRIAKNFGIAHITYEARLIGENTPKSSNLKFLIILFHNLYIMYKKLVIKLFKRQIIYK